MATKRHFVKNIRSSQLLSDGSPKLPTAEQIEYGEIAVNYAKGHETLSLKNSENEIITLYLEATGKIDDVKVNGTTVVNNRIADITLNSSVIPHTPTSGTETNVKDAINSLTSKTTVDTNDKILSQTTNGITSKIQVQYVSADKKIYFYGSAIDDAHKLGEVDATDFIKDGMLNSVDYSEGDTEHLAENGPYLVFTWNTDSGKTLPMWISLKGLVSEYTAGEGIDITDHVVSADFDVVAKKDDIQTYTAGEGLNLNDNEFSVDFDTVAKKSELPTVPEYTAGEGINITDHVVSADFDVVAKKSELPTVPEYTAGEGIDITDHVVSTNSDMIPHTYTVGEEEIETTVGEELKQIKGEIAAVSVSSPKNTILVNGKEVEVNVDKSTLKYAEDGNSKGKIYVDSEVVTADLKAQVIEDERVTAESITKLATAAGTLGGDDKIEYIPVLDANYIADAESVHDATVILDEQLKAVEDKLDEAGKIDDVEVNGTSVVENKIAKITMTSDVIPHTYTVGEEEIETTVGDELKQIKGEISAVSVSSKDNTILVDGKDVSVHVDKSTLKYAEDGDSKGKIYVDSEVVTADLKAQVIEDERVTAESITKLATAAGTINEADEIGYIPVTDANYIADAESVHDATVILDEQLKAVEDKLDEAGKIDDVKVNGASVVVDKVADIEMTSDVIPHTYTVGEEEIETTVGEELEKLKGEITAVSVSSPKNTILVNGKEVEVNVDKLTLKYAEDGDSKGKIYVDSEVVTADLKAQVIEDEKVTAEAVSKLAVAAGTLNGDNKIEYISVLDANYIADAESVHDATVILDEQLKEIENKVDNINLDSSAISHTPEGEGAVETTVKDELWGIRNDLDFNIRETIAAREDITSLQNDTINISNQLIDDEKVIAESITKLAESAGTLGDDYEIIYTPETTANYINNAVSVHDATVILDEQLKSVENKIDDINTLSVSSNDKILSENNSVISATVQLEYNSSDKKIYLYGSDKDDNHKLGEVDVTSFPGGGEGTTYTEGNGINITDNNEIEIDTDVVAVKGDIKTYTGNTTQIVVDEDSNVISLNSDIAQKISNSLTEVTPSTSVTDDYVELDVQNNNEIGVTVTYGSWDEDGAVSEDGIAKVNDVNTKIDQVVNKLQKEISGIEYVDLGLPSGTKWLKYNVGATKETELGNYYQWGKLLPEYDFNYNEGTNAFENAEFIDSHPYLFDTYETYLETEDAPRELHTFKSLRKWNDVVYQTTNGVAHMPTVKQIDELIHYTRCDYTDDYKDSGVAGYKFSSLDYSSEIFFPISGHSDALDDISVFILSKDIETGADETWPAVLYVWHGEEWHIVPADTPSLFVNRPYLGMQIRGVID